MNPIFYTDVGSRNTPDHILIQMQTVASILAKVGLVLRSGGSVADNAFEEGCDLASGSKEIWLPWASYRDNASPFIASEAHKEKAASFGRGWEHISDSFKKHYSAAVAQVFGKDLKTPARFVICYTADGCEHYSTISKETGGIREVILMASLSDIPVFNLANPDVFERLHDFADPLRREMFSSVPRA